MSDITPLDHFENQDYIPTSDEKTMSVLAHVLTLVAGFISPLVIYLVKKDESEYVRKHAVESLNFQISVFIYAMACIPLIFIIVGVFLLMGLALAAFILTIIATVKASEGNLYKYPLTLRLIR